MHCSEVSRAQFAQDGYIWLRQLFTTTEMRQFADRLAVALDEDQHTSVLRSKGRVYGSRNLLEVVPDVVWLLCRLPLQAFVTDVLGSEAGLVRALFFDKPPDRTWSLPWHKDRTIAVRRNDLPSSQFQNPTSKAGVPHVEASDDVLAQMLTIRIHLDPMTKSNGPLSVMPGSHRAMDEPPRSPQQLHAAAGDVLAMRPLLTHASVVSKPGTVLHRRIIHFEMAAGDMLPDGYAWHTFLRLQDLASATEGGKP